jgi:curved DNA-binding protein CbpA
VKAAWRAQVKLEHPDSTTSDANSAPERLAAIQDAYAVLSDQRLRTLYDDLSGVTAEKKGDEDAGWDELTPGQALAVKFLLTAAQEIEERVSGSGTDESTYDRSADGSILLTFEIYGRHGATYSYCYAIDPIGRFRGLYGKAEAQGRSDLVKVGRGTWADPGWSAPVTEDDLRAAQQR